MNFFFINTNAGLLFNIWKTQPPNLIPSSRGWNGSEFSSSCLDTLFIWLQGLNSLYWRFFIRTQTSAWVCWECQSCCIVLYWRLFSWTCSRCKNSFPSNKVVMHRRGCTTMTIKFEHAPGDVHRDDSTDLFKCPKCMRTNKNADKWRVSQLLFCFYFAFGTFRSHIFRSDTHQKMLWVGTVFSGVSQRSGLLYSLAWCTMVEFACYYALGSFYSCFHK